MAVWGCGLLLLGKCRKVVELPKLSEISYAFADVPFASAASAAKRFHTDVAHCGLGPSAWKHFAAGGQKTEASACEQSECLNNSNFLHFPFADPGAI